MIRARAVVADAAAKLRPDQDGGIVFPAVRLQVLIERTHGPGDILPQLSMGDELTAMGVETAVGGVVDLRAQLGKHHLSHALEVIGDRTFWIVHGGRILFRRGPEDICAMQRVHPVLSQKRQDLIFHIAAVHLAEGIEYVLLARRVINFRK